MPIGYLITMVLAAASTAFALNPPIPRHSRPFRLRSFIGFLPSELPFVLLAVLVASTGLAEGQGMLWTPVGVMAFALATLTTVGLVVVIRRSLRARRTVDEALSEAFGRGWRRAAGTGPTFRPRRHLPWGRILFAPYVRRRHDVERVADISYGDAGKQNQLDVYRNRTRPSGGPVLVHFHGGAFRHGRKSREARSLLARLASHGWVCVSANYRLSPEADLRDQLVDVKRVIAWVREHGAERGADPSTVFVAGSSAGAHLASAAALTPNDPAYQPGFERVDTSVSGVVLLAGFYGSVNADDDGSPSSSLANHDEEPPPFFVAHGDLDTIVVVADARRFVAGLRRVSDQPVVYAELPGAPHAFDRFQTIRFEIVVDAIEAFTAAVRRGDVTRATPTGDDRTGRDPTRPEGER